MIMRTSHGLPDIFDSQKLARQAFAEAS